MNHPYLDPSFLVSWSRLTPDAIKPDVMEAIARARANIQASATSRWTPDLGKHLRRSGKSL